MNSWITFYNWTGIDINSICDFFSLRKSTDLNA